MFAALVSFFGLQASQGSGYTLASLRGGGATALYLLGASLEDISWLDRWASKRTLESYIQEVAALLSLSALSHRHQMRIRRFCASHAGASRGVELRVGWLPLPSAQQAQAAAGL